MRAAKKNLYFLSGFFLSSKSPFMREGTVLTSDPWNKVVDFMAAAHKMSFKKCSLF